jgi:outer membrane protein assembly factor BamB
MAQGQSKYRKLITAPVIVALATLSVFTGLSSQCVAETVKKPKTHFLSWESVNAHDRLRPWRQVSRPERRFEVKRRKVVHLKKPSLFDRRPVQFATPIASEYLLYVGNNKGLFYCIDMRENKKVWIAPTEGGIESPAAVSESNVYVGDIKGYAYSFDASTGQELWKIQLGGEILGAPLVVGDAVYFVTLSGRLFAIQRLTGIELWHTDAMEKQIGFTVRRQSSPVYYNGSVIFGTSRGTLVSYFEDGSINWLRMLGDPSAQVMDVDSRPLIIADRLYAASADGTLYCLNPNDGSIIWAIEAGGVNDLLFDEGMLYATGKGMLFAVDPDTGMIHWSQNLDVAALSSPAAGEGYIAIVDTVKKLYLIDNKTGDIVYERYIRKGSYGDPVVVGNMVYVLANSSRVFSFLVYEKERKTKAVQKEEKKEIKEEG